MADATTRRYAPGTRDWRWVLLVASAAIACSLTTSRRVDAQTNSLTVCNTGTATFWLAVVEMFEGGLFMSDRFFGEGWIEVRGGGCRRVFDRAYFDVRVAFLAFGYRDASGTFGLSYVIPDPDSPGLFKPPSREFGKSTRVFCSMSVQFSFKNVPLQESQNCPDIGSATPQRDANGQFIFRMPYTLSFVPDCCVSGLYTFKASVNPATRVWQPLPR